MAGNKVTVQMWVLWAVVFEFWCDWPFGPGQGWTKKTISEACPTVLGEGNEFRPRGSSLLLKTQRQN